MSKSTANNLVKNVSLGGLKINNNGNIERGDISKKIHDGTIGEITGATAKLKTQRAAENTAAQAAVDAQNATITAQTSKMNQDIAASTGTAAIRATGAAAQAQANGTAIYQANNGSQNLGQDQKDFLGL